MKKLLSIVFVAVMAVGLTATLSFALGSGAGIVNSPHDLSAQAWNTTGEICRVCHVPHDHTRNTGDVGLLWNHTLSSSTYLMYAEDTHTNFIDGAADPEPTGISKLCLGCHDGTVAIDDFGELPTTTSLIGTYDPDYQIPAIADVGTDKNLSNTHPISIFYDNLSDPGLNPPTNVMGTLSGGQTYTIDDVLDGGKVQCSSCHDVHDEEAVPGTHLLRVPNTIATGVASGLCLTCHNK